MSDASSNRDNSRARIIDALMELVVERAFNSISLADVAVRAGVSLADLRDAFPSKGAVVAAEMKRIDRAVLDQFGGVHEDEAAKERLRSVLERRLDAMAPRKEAWRGIAEWARREPRPRSTGRR